jgi:hypothetical protein
MDRAMAAVDIDTMTASQDRIAAARGDVAARAKALRGLAHEVMMRSGSRLPADLIPGAQALADAVAKCWDIMGYDGESIRRQDRRDEAGQAGDVHRHGRKGSEYDPAKTGRLRAVSRLESEHVVPWAWIQRIVGTLFRLGDLPPQSTKKDATGAVTQQGSAAYPRMTTVMTYERAAEFKTSQLANNDAEFKRWIDRVGPTEARRTLAEHLPALVNSRVQIITNATGLYVAKVQREDGITLPDRPDRATITRAAAAQLAEIFAAVREAER